MTVVSRRLVAKAIADRLAGVTNAVGYFGQVGRTLAGDFGPEFDPQPKSDTDPRVKAYYVLFPGAGGPGPDPDLGDCAIDATIPEQITVAGGDIEDVLGLVDRIWDRLYGWEPAVEGLVCGPLKPPPGYSPGQVLIDRNVKPERLYVPLLFQLTATT